MGSVFKKIFTKPVPEGAEIFTRAGKRFARWKPKGGKTRTAALTEGADGSPRILGKSATYIAKYRDGEGRVVEPAIPQRRLSGCPGQGFGSFQNRLWRERLPQGANLRVEGRHEGRGVKLETGLKR